jgi:hypothetical protein
MHDRQSGGFHNKLVDEAVRRGCDDASFVGFLDERLTLLERLGFINADDFRLDLCILSMLAATES